MEIAILIIITIILAILLCIWIDLNEPTIKSKSRYEINIIFENIERLEKKIDELEKENEELKEWITLLNAKSFVPPFDTKTSPISKPFDPSK